MRIATQMSTQAQRQLVCAQAFALSKLRRPAPQASGVRGRIRLQRTASQMLFAFAANDNASEDASLYRLAVS